MKPGMDRELETLIGALRENTLTPEQAEALRTRLRQDKTARRELIEQMMLVAALREADFASPSSHAAPSTSLIHLPAWWTQGIKWAAALALLAIIGISFWAIRQNQVIGQVIRLEAAGWNPGQFPIKEGTSLKRGSFNLASGLAELKLGAHVRIILEGPARMDLLNAGHCYLHNGKAVVRAEKEGRGFTLDGPQGRIVDEGTEFGVSVNGSTGMEVHVLEGKVMARRQEPGIPDKPVELVVHQALQWNATNPVQRAAKPLEFVTDLPPRSDKTLNYVHWSFDEGDGTLSRNRGNGLGGTNADAFLRSINPQGSGPRWTSGQFGAGISFNGTDDYVECRFPGISGGNPRTVAFWVKVPRDFDPSQGFGMVSWGTFMDGMAWQISVNPVEKDGRVGALRAGIHPASVIGATDLRDDRWHHVAVVMYGGHRPDISTHVLLYVDGRMEQTTTKAVMEIRTETAHLLSKSVRLGRNIDEKGYGHATGWRFFRGCLDEIFIFDGALSQAQVQSLMWHNRLTGNLPNFGAIKKNSPAASGISMSAMIPLLARVDSIPRPHAHQLDWNILPINDTFFYQPIPQ